MDTIPGLDLTEAIELLARRRAAEDGYIWDHTPELWANLGQFQSEYLAEAKGVLDLVAPAIEAQVLARAARTLEWLDLTGATVIVAEASRTLVFAFTHKHSLAQDEELLQRLRASIPGHRIVIADGVQVGVGETEQPTTKESE